MFSIKVTKSIYIYTMLDLLKRKKIKKLNKPLKTKFKHYPSSVREWNNSIYLYNKNSLNLIPSTTVTAMKIIKSFFSIYNKSLERKIRTKRLLLRLRRLSSNRIYLSNGEFKHFCTCHRTAAVSSSASSFFTPAPGSCMSVSMLNPDCQPRTGNKASRAELCGWQLRFDRDSRALSRVWGIGWGG